MEIDLLGAFKLKLGTDVDAMYKSENFLLQISLQKALDDHSKSLNSLFCTEDSKMASRSLISEISGKLGYSLAQVENTPIGEMTKVLIKLASALPTSRIIVDFIS